jgi:hypothetical protein
VWLPQCLAPGRHCTAAVVKPSHCQCVASAEQHRQSHTPHHSPLLPTSIWHTDSALTTQLRAWLCTADVLHTCMQALGVSACFPARVLLLSLATALQA